MARMTAAEWKKKKAEQNGGTSVPPTVTEPSSETKRMTPSEWREKKAATSLQGWGQSAWSLLSATQQHFSAGGLIDDEAYHSLADRKSTLLAQADSWRKQYAGNTEAISYIDSVVDALDDASRKAVTYDRQNGLLRRFNSSADVMNKYSSGIYSQEELDEYSKAVQDYLVTGSYLYTEKNGFSEADINKWKGHEAATAVNTAKVSDWYELSSSFSSNYDVMKGYDDKISTGAYMTQDELDEYSKNAQSYLINGSKLYTAENGFSEEDINKWRDHEAATATHVAQVMNLHSGFSTEEDYNFWYERNTPEKRLAWYEQQQNRLNELQAEFQSLEGQNLPYEEFMRRTTEIATEGQAIQAEMAKYERGEDNDRGLSYGSKAVDDYYYLTKNDDFSENSTPKTYDNGVDRLGIYHAIEAGTQSGYADVYAQANENGWAELNEDETAIYYYLLNTQGADSAKTFLENMKTVLNRRQTMSDIERWREEYDAAGGFGKFWMNVKSVPANVFGGVAGTIDNLAQTISGETINPYSSSHSGVHYSNTVREETAADLDGIGFDFFDLADFYQAGMSFADSMLAMGVGGSFGGAFLAMGAAENEAIKLYKAGASNSQIFWGSVAAGATEMIFESISIGELKKIKNMKSPKTLGQYFKTVLVQAGVEASEEVLTSIANTVSNAFIMGSQSDWAKLVDENDGSSWEAFKAKTLEVLHDGLAGAVSGGIGGGTVGFVSKVQNNSPYRKAGRTIKAAEGGIEALKSLAMEKAGATTDIDGKTSENLKKQAGKLSNKTSAKKVGMLYEATQKAGNIANASANQADIAKSLQRKGFNEETANDLATALVAEYNGQELTKAQEKLLKSAKDSKVVKEAISNIMLNEKSTMGQRSQYIRDFANEIEVGRIAKTYGVSKDEAKTLKEMADAIRDGKAVNSLSTAETVYEGNYAVSKDGKTSVDGKEVKLDGFKETDAGVMVATDDGQTVDGGDVTYSSNGHALVYEGYLNLMDTAMNPVIANMSVDSKSKLAKAFDLAPGTNGKLYFNGANQAFWYGYEGMSLDDNSIPVNSPIRALNEEQIKIAYEEGRKAGEKATNTQQSAIEAAQKAAVEKLGGKKGVARAAKKNGGSVILDSGIDESSMTKTQKASKDLADKVAQAIGKNVHIYRGMQEYGKYDSTTGEIWLNINGNISGKSMMAFALSHELVHMAKQWSPADYKAFADYLVQQYGKNGVSVEALVKMQMDNAIENGYELDWHEAYEEVIADACQRMLLDSDALQKMAAYRVKNPDKWQRIVDSIKDFINKIRKAFKGAEPDSLESALFKDFDKAVKKELENKFVTMVMNSSEHMTTIQNAFGKDTVVEVNADGEFTLAKGKVDGATKFLYNDSTWEGGGRDTLSAALKAEGFSQEDIDAALTIMDGKHKLVKELAKQFPEQDRINKATITTDLKDGHSVLSALVSNGDYPVNIDLLMVCKKRKAYQRVINRLCETGLIQQATVDALAIAEINKILGKYGFETACLGCFVESRRLRIQEWAETIVKEWNSQVKKRNPNAKAFGFGKGEATLTEGEVMQLVGELEGHTKNDKGNLNLGQGSAVKRMGVLLDKVPSLAKTLTVEDLITPDGLTALRQYDSNLFSMVKSRYGSNSPKFVQEFNPYNHELAKYGKVPKEYKSLREYLYAIGGARMQSFSDFIVENWFDYCQIVADLAARKLPMHTYTKEIALAKLFGLTGIKINMSLIPDIDRSMGRDFAGLTRNENGELELIWADKDRFKKTGGKSYMQSINFADAIALQNDPRYSGNVGTIAVGVSKNHILMMLDDARIRMIIPYHSSGMNPIFADLMGTSYYTDYTNVQNTRVKQMYNSKGQKVSMKLEKAQVAKLTAGFQFNEVLQELGDARAAADAYKEWCADASKHTITIKGETYTAELTPKFDEFAWHDNYYKLLEDFNTYDCISEEAAPQGDVKQIYPENFDDVLKAELTAQETHRQKQEKHQAFDNAMGEIESYLSTHTKADTVFYAEQHGVKLSDKDKKLNAADKAKIADLRKGMKMSMPKAKAPTFYSQMAKVVDGVKQEKLGASSIVSMLRGKGVKAEEIKWSGIEAWLDGKKSVTNAELQTFIAGSMLQIEEEVLDNKDRPYTEDQQKRLDEYEAKRGEVANRLAAEWKKITGDDLTVHNASGIESWIVHKIIDANRDHKDATFEGRLLKKLGKDLEEVIKNNDDFGFDSWHDALRSIHRHRRDFIKNYEMSANDKAIIAKYCNALNAYNELPNMISDADTDRLRAIASEVGPWNRKIMEIKNEHNEYEAKYMTEWKEYSLKGGKNYREMLFRIPGSDYSNAAMYTHWKQRKGVLAHARVQDMDTPNGKMLFIEEIQSDWHNEGHKGKTEVPDAPFADTYHEYVLKRLLREAAEQGYDSIGWTPADIQMKRWNPNRKTNAQMGLTDAKNPDAIAFEEGYRIEYDQDIPKFLTKYGKKWGATVGKTTLGNGTEVWSMEVTDSMKDSVLYEGQPKYSMPKVNSPYSYDALISKPDMVVTTVSGNVPKNRADVIVEAKKNAASVGRVDPKTGSVSVYVDDIGEHVFLGRDGLRHSIDRRVNVNAPVVIKAGEILSNSIRINELKPREKNATESYVLIGAARNDSGELFVVRSVINRFTYKLTSMDVLYAINAKKEPAALLPLSTGKPALGTDSTISIAKLLDYVNQYFPDILPVDVYQHYGHESRPSGELGESALYKSPNSRGMSPRQLLANAFDTLAQTPTEREKMAEYRKNIAMVEDVQERLRKLRDRISELTRENGDKAKIAEMNKTAKGLADLIDKYDRKLLELEASKPLRDVLARAKSAAYQEARERSEKSLAEYRQQVSERFDRGIENRRKTEMRKKIRKTIRDLDKILNRGSKKRNVKEDMKGFVESAITSAEVLFTDNYTNEDMIRNGVGVIVSPEEQRYLDEARAILAEISNLPSGSYEAMLARQEAEGKLKNQLAYRMTKLKDTFLRERIRLAEAEVSEVLGNLADEYAKLKNSEHEYVKGAFHESVHNYIKFVQEDIGGTKIKDMNLSQLETLYKAYTMVMTTVRDANKAFVAGKNVDQLVEKLVTEFGGRKMPKKKIGAIARNLSNMTGWNYEKLYYALDRIGSDTLTELFTNLANSENIVMADVIEAKQVQAAIVEKYGYNSWKVDQEIDKDFVDNTGKVFRLTLGEMMSLYAYSRREGAWNHIEYGGFVFGKTALTDVDPVSAYKLTKEQCEEITNTLTENQKKFAEEMQTFLSDVMGAKGNEVSMLLYGIEMFGEKNYFPIHIAGQFKANAQESQAKAEAGFSSMTNAGFTQAQNKKAKAPFVMESFMDVWVDHVNEMSRYHGTVPALEDIRKVMNYSYYSDSYQDSMSVKAIMENKFGKQAVDYFNNLYQEANSGAITDKMQKSSHKLLSKFRKNSVAYSLSVLVQQPLSMIRAFALIDKKYFSGPRGWGAVPIGITKSVFNRWTKVQDNAYAEMLKYAPGVTLAKEIGGFDTASGHSIRSYLLDTDKKLKQKWKTGTVGGKAQTVVGLVDDNPIANLPNVADKIAWIEIWNACKRETAETHKTLSPSSEAFMQEVGKRFTEIIRATQVYDSIFAKSPMLKSKNLAVQYLVSFMNEPNTVANMVESGARDIKNGDIRKGSRKITSVIRALVMTGVIKSIIYAMRDDDEDETYAEKYTEALVSSLLSDITIFNYIPIARDVWSVSQGYDVERPDMAIVSDAISSLTNVLSNMGKDTSDMTEAELEEWDKKVTDANWKLVDSVAAFFGIPVKNIRREINAVMDHARIAHENSGKTTWNSIEDAVDQAIADASPAFARPEIESKTDKIYDAIIDGDTAYLERLKSGYKDTNAYNNAVKKALLENDPRIKEAAQAQVNGDPSERVRIAKLIVADGFPQDAVVMAINTQINDLTPDEGSTGTKKAKGYYTTSDFAREISNGDWDAAETARDDVIATAQKNGKSGEEAEESFASSAKSEIKELFVAGKMSESNAVKALKTYCPAKDGPLDDDDIYWIIREWEYEKANGSSDDYGKYNDFHGAVQTGKNLKAVIGEYTSNGVSKETLASQITSHFKPLYKAMTNYERASIKGYLLNAYEQLGYDRTKKSKDIDKWLDD